MKTTYISEGAMKRLFRMAIRANDAIENASDDEDYKSLKKRSDEWNEIVMALGLSNELRRYYAEQRGDGIESE